MARLGGIECMVCNPSRTHGDFHVKVVTHSATVCIHRPFEDGPTNSKGVTAAHECLRAVAHCIGAPYHYLCCPPKLIQVLFSSFIVH